MGALRLLVARWPVVVGFVVLGIGAGLVYTAFQPTAYSATSTLVLSPASGVLDPESARDLPALARTIETLATTDTVLAAAREGYVESATGDERAAREDEATLTFVADNVSADVPFQTSLVEITATGSNQDAASDLARATATSVIVQVADLRPANGGAGLRIDRFGPTAENGQISPTPGRNILLGANLGLIVGIIVALLLSDRGLRLRGARDFSEILGEENLVLLPGFDAAEAEHNLQLSNAGYWISPSDPDSAAFHVLRARVSERLALGDRHIAILGPVPESILRLVALNLAAYLSLSGPRPIVIEADFHGEGWAFDDAPRPPGLVHALQRGELDGDVVDLPIRLGHGAHSAGEETWKHIAMLPAGGGPSDGAAALASPTLVDFMDTLATEYDAVLIVGPSIEYRTESLAVLARADATIVVLDTDLSASEARAVAGAPEAESDRLLAFVLTGEQ